MKKGGGGGLEVLPPLQHPPKSGHVERSMMWAEADETERVAVKTPYRFNLKTAGSQSTDSKQRPESVFAGLGGNVDNSQSVGDTMEKSKKSRTVVTAHARMQQLAHAPPNVYLADDRPEYTFGDQTSRTKVEFLLSDFSTAAERQSGFGFYRDKTATGGGGEFDFERDFSEMVRMTQRSMRKLPPIEVSGEGGKDGNTFLNPEFLLKSKITWGDSSHTKCVESFERPWWLKRKGLWIPDKITEENPYFSICSGASLDEKYVPTTEIRESTYQLLPCDRFIRHMLGEREHVAPVEKKKKAVQPFKFWTAPPKPITKAVNFYRRSAEFVEFPPLFEETGEAVGDLVMPHVWKCQHCKDTFDTKKEYDDHQTHYHSFKCKECGSVFASANALERHKVSSHFGTFEDKDVRPSEEQVGVSMYKDSQLDMDSLDTHGFGKAHDYLANLILFGCGVCQKKFTTQEESLTHFHTHELFGCDKCREVFGSASELRVHKLDKHGVSCSHCADRFLDEKELNEHVKSAHGFCCDSCDKWYLSQKELDEHFLDAHGLKCPKCSFKFKTQEDLDQHLETVHAPKFVCPTCKASFKTREELMEHRESEHAPKFGCSECEKKFMTQEELDEHLKSHPLIKCKSEDCSEKFFTDEENDKHFEDTHAPKFACNKCEQKFFTKEELNTHHEKVHPRAERKKRTKKEVAKPEKKVEKAEPEPPPREPTPEPEPVKEPTPPPTPPPVKTLTPPPLPVIEEPEEEVESEESEEEELPGLSKRVDPSKMRESRKKAMLMYNNMHKGKKPPKLPKPITPPPVEFDDFDFLSKYCIFNKEKYEQFKTVFQQTDVDKDGWMSPVEILTGLKVLGGQFDITDKQAEYIFRILEVADYSPHFGADFQLFCIVASLAQKIQSVDDFMKSLIRNVDLEMLSSRCFKLKQFFLANVDDYSNAISISSLMLELKAGGISGDNEQKVYDKLAHLHCLNLLDFMTYCPLFILIHDTVIENPFNREVLVN